MRRLLLLRHAKSSWDRSDLDDVDRPLAPRGRRAAPLMGRYIDREGLMPDLVLCSPAVRARQTWELVAAEWDRSAVEAGPRLEMRASLYLAVPGEIIAILRRLDDEIGTVLVIGHNPGMAMLGKLLAARGDPHGMKAMSMKFPTAALAVMTFDVEGWTKIAPGNGYLRSFVRPKDLA